MLGWDVHRLLPGLLLAGLLLAPLTPPADGYSVLSHEALIDAAWTPAIAPLLRSRFPAATPAELEAAHAFAYGGSVLQDMGYYPFGNRFFSNLAHYARPGSFVLALLNEARTVDEYAFALGALSHYVADTIGHPEGVNLSVPQMYPDLRRKYGRRVTYEDDARAHVATEFSFDVVQVSGAGYLPRTYHNFIGFAVPRGLVERAFASTYGLSFRELFFWEGLSLAIYKVSSSEIIPTLSEDVWKHARKKLIRRDPQLVTPRFRYRLAQGNYQGSPAARRRLLRPWTWQWRRSARRANVRVVARVIVTLAEILPKVGALRTLAFQPPTLPVQDLFIGSFDNVVTSYESSLSALLDGGVTLDELNLDTGRPLAAGHYELADATYARWLRALDRQHFHTMSAAARQNILNFYGDLQGPIATKKDSRRWGALLRELERLRAAGSVRLTAAR